LKDCFLEKIQKTIEPAQKLISYYRCALMAIEIKCRVLDEEFSYLHERNPIDNRLVRQPTGLSDKSIILLEKKDYIVHPKETGYRSLHLIIETPLFPHNEKRYMKVAIQLRSIAMDFWANLEHRLRYKNDMRVV
jgi:putative GTP pyrophosphokinase